MPAWFGHSLPMVLSWPNGLTEPLKISHDSLQIFLCLQGAGEQLSLRMPMPMLNQPQSVLLSGPLFSRLRIASTGARKASMVKREKGAIVRSCQPWSVNICYCYLCAVHLSEPQILCCHGTLQENVVHQCVLTKAIPWRVMTVDGSKILKGNLPALLPYKSFCTRACSCAARENIHAFQVFQLTSPCTFKDPSTAKVKKM